MLNISLGDGKTIQVKEKTRLEELSSMLQGKCGYPYLGAKVENEIKELSYALHRDCSVDFFDITSKEGMALYQRSVSFLFICAVKELTHIKCRIVIEHSIQKNFYCEILDKDLALTDEFIQQVEDKMKALVAEDLPIVKITMPLEEALEICKNQGMEDKINILKYRRTSTVNMYRIQDIYDYFYGGVVSRTGQLPLFALKKQGNGLLIRFPSQNDPTQLQPLQKLNKLSQVFLESARWARILGVDTVGALNEHISKERIGHIIRVSEALHEKKIANIADQIAAQKDVKLVLIAGPSSSGKTTFSQRLCVHLEVNGLRPHVIALDNYFVDREKTPLDEYGKKDYESIKAIDDKQLNKDFTALLAGETVEIPYYNFIDGKREYRGNFITPSPSDIIIAEGIHGLNEVLTADIPKKNKFKIYVSALTQLNVDDHNRIPTTDSRLLRRIVRDNQYRGMNAATTIAMWDSVTRGEAKNIFPYQEEADVMFNSALVYELCVLKNLVEPLLFAIDSDIPQYSEAKRLIKFLDSFLGISTEDVPHTSIIREFIGGSVFEV